MLFFFLIENTKYFNTHKGRREKVFLKKFIVVYIKKGLLLLLFFWVVWLVTFHYHVIVSCKLCEEELCKRQGQL